MAHDGDRTGSGAARADARRAQAGGPPEPQAVADARAGLDALRQRIDELDEELVRLLNARAACALEIGRLKQVLGMDIYQPGRERDVLEHVRSATEGPLDGAAVARLFERIIDEARSLERMAYESDE